MIKLTVIYGYPSDTAAFEDHYKNTHLPLASKMSGFEKVEFTKFLSAPDGSKPGQFRMAEFWFTDSEGLQATMGSHEGQAIAADIANFATGGVTMLEGAVDN